MSRPGAKPPPRRAPWPRVSPRCTAAALAGHSALGLAFGAIVYLVCLTGTLSVFADELKLAEQRAPRPTVYAPGALDRAAAQALRQLPPGATLYLTAASTPRERLTASTYGPDGERAWIADAQGRLTPERTPWTDWLVALHMSLTAPAPWGTLAVGLAGAALLALIGSGVLAHPRILRDAFRLRLSGSARLREAEWHNRLSVWGLPFHLTVTLTGALFGLASLTATAVAALAFHGDVARVYRPLTGPTVAADARPAPAPELEGLVARATASRPGSRLVYVGLEGAGTRGARVVVEVTAPGRLPRGEDVIFDGCGREIGRGRFASGGLGLQAYAAAAQLHFGAFGGLPVRLAYGVLGAALSYVCATGVTIWLLRCRDRGRPAPRLERAWAGWTWVAPAAIALAAIASPWLPPGQVFWGATLLAQALAALSLPRDISGRIAHRNGE